MSTSRTHHLICIILIGIQVFSTITGYTYEGIPILSGLTGSIVGGQDSIAELIKERDTYSAEHTGITDVTTFDSSSDLIGSTYVIEKTSRVRGQVGERIVTSDLLHDTLVRNMSDREMDPRAIAIHAVPQDSQSRVTKKFGNNPKNKLDQVTNQVITFEFGIPGNHLIFSKPVLLSIDSGNIPDGSWVDLLVLHAGDTDYNTSGLMTDVNGECLPDGTATKPASRAKVIGSKVSFYTCGASTFALGYVPARDIPNNTVWTLAPTADNKIIIGGDFTGFSGATMGRVARLTKEGFLDPTFSDPNVNGRVYTSAIQSDGKILIGGAFTSVGGSGRTYLARLNIDGTLDTTFDVNITGSGGNKIKAIKIQTNGKILIGGTFTMVGGVPRNHIARLNSDGSLDTTFDANAGASVYTVAIQSDGNILLGGLFATMGGSPRTTIARVNRFGVLDPTFNPILVSTAVMDIKIQTDGNILFAGQFTQIDGTIRNNIARVSTLGVLDATFDPNVNATVYTLFIESSGNIILGGFFSTVGGLTRTYFARILPSGNLDLSLDVNADNRVYTIETRRDGIIAIGGQFTNIFTLPNTSSYITYMNPIGIPDSTYKLGIDNTIWTLSSTADNKIIIGGGFTTVGGVPMSRVARVSTGGSLDPTFTNLNINNTVYASAIQSDGKILIGGTFTSVGGSGRTYLARLNIDGTLDTTFNVPITGSEVRTIKIASNGDILIGGTFTNVGGRAKTNVARLDSTGTTINAFTANTNGTVYTISIQSDNMVLIGGIFTILRGQGRTQIGRVNGNNGNIDNTFNPALIGTEVMDIQVQTDGNIVFGGTFTQVNTITRNNIARVSTLGVLDTTFDPNTNATVQTILIESNGNIIFGGNFTSVGSGTTTRNRIARYSSVGVLDTTLNPNANNTVYALGKDQSFNLLVGGLFTTMSTKAVPYFSWVGLNTDLAPPVIDSISLASGSLLPIGNLVVTTTYSDTGIGIDVASVAITLEKWNGTIWGPNIAATYLATVPIITTGTGIHSLAGIPYGKYRFRTFVSDLVGNTSVIQRVFYVDAIEWSVSQPSVDIGSVVGGIQKNSSPDEFVITVKTVGAPFSLSISGSELVNSGEIISHWTGSGGYGHEIFNGAYSGALSSHSGGAYIVTQPQALNPDGDKNTYTYRMQFGTRVSAEQEAGNYVAPISFQMVSSY